MPEQVSLYVDGLHLSNEESHLILTKVYTYIYKNKYNIYTYKYRQNIGLPQWLSSKESTCNTGSAGAAVSIPGFGRSPGGGHGGPLQYSCLGNPMNRGPWQATVHGVTKSRTQLKPLSMQAHT